MWWQVMVGPGWLDTLSIAPLSAVTQASLSHRFAAFVQRLQFCAQCAVCSVDYTECFCASIVCAVCSVHFIVCSVKCVAQCSIVCSVSYIVV